jgi:hypothetical protein
VMLNNNDGGLGVGRIVSSAVTQLELAT